MSRLGLLWVVLVSPANGWRALRSLPASAWPALLTQAMLLLLGWTLAAKPMGELAELSGLGKDGASILTAFLGIAVIVVALAIVAGLLKLLVKAVGSAISFRTLLTWLAYGVTPVFIGRFLGLVSFAVFRPLAKDPQDALALQFNPLSLSLASLFYPLSLPWMLAASLDVFALWSLLLLASGALHYLQLGAARTAALLGTLLLIWLLVLTTVWQGLQRSL